MTTYAYKTTDEDPSIPFYVTDFAGAVVDLSAATFAVRVVRASTGALVSTITTVTGYATAQGTSPNLYNAVLTWAAGDLATIGAGVYRLEMQCTIASRQRSVRVADPPLISISAVAA